MTEDIQSTQAKNKVQPNFAFDYKGIRHVASPLAWGSEDDFKASVIEKYRRIAAGLDPVTGEPKHAPAGSAIKPASDLAPKDKDFKEEYRQTAVDAENARLKAELKALRDSQSAPNIPNLVSAVHNMKTGAKASQVAATEAPVVKEDDPPVKSTPKGVCPDCGKTGVKRMDMHKRNCKAA